MSALAAYFSESLKKWNDFEWEIMTNQPTEICFMLVFVFNVHELFLHILEHTNYDSYKNLSSLRRFPRLMIVYARVICEIFINTSST